MDPNATLGELRLLANAASDGLSEDNLDEALDRMAELVQSLDAWLSKGGFMPEAWSHFYATSN